MAMSSFENKLLECCNNAAVCRMGICCGCYLAGKVAESVGENSLIHSLFYLTPLRVFTLTKVRRKIRRKYNIRGNILQDVFESCFCVPCTVMQEAQEIIREDD